LKTYIIWLSQLLWSVSELAILGKRAVLVLHEVLAKLSLIFLFQRVKLTLISIEIFVIWLLSQLSNDFAWWIVKISFSLLIVRSFLLVFIFQIGIFVRNSLGRIGIFFRIIFQSFSIFNLKVFWILLVLNWSLRIWRRSFLRSFNTFGCLCVLLFLRLVVLSLFFALSFFWILNCHFLILPKYLLFIYAELLYIFPLDNYSIN